MSAARNLALPVAILLLIPAQAEEWRMYLKELSHSSFNASEVELSRNTLPRLQAAWTRHMNAGLAAAVTPANGVLYFGDWGGHFYAVDAQDGRVLWAQYVGKAPDPADPDCISGLGVTSQATVSGDTVYVGGGDSSVYALNASTGDVLWRVPLADPDTGTYLWSSITLYAGGLYVGVASMGDCPLVRGAVARIDLAAPERPLIRYLVPEEEEGAGVWSTPAIDAATNTLYITTGNGDQNAADGFWGGTFMALDATTLETKAYFFLPTNSLEDDIEWGSSPVLFTTPDGVEMTAATGKDGVLYGLRRSDLSLVWQTKLAVQCTCPECGCGSLSTPAFDGKTLYVGAGVRDPAEFAQGSMYAINPADGQVIWERDMTGVVIAPVTVANQLVFVSTDAGLEILDATTGERLWNDQQVSGEYHTLYSQAVVVDGAVFATYLNGDVVAWRVGPGYVRGE